MTTVQDFALLANAAYFDKAGLANLPVLPPGWERREDLGLGSTTGGFSAEVFVKGNEVVVSYQGTSTKPLTADFLEDWVSNGSLAFGAGGDQLTKAALLLKQVQAYFESQGQAVSISVAGHSLGGGLAGLISVFFDVPAKVYAPAPFAASASRAIATKIRQSLAASGFTDGALDSLLGSTNFAAAIAARETSIEALSLKGEVLEAIRTSSNTLALALDAVDIGTPDIGALGLHSMQLHAAVIQSDPLRDASRTVPQLFRLMADQDLYGRDLGDQENKDILQRLIEFQIGTDTVGAKNMLNQFGLDGQQIGQSGAIAQPLLREAATSTLLEYYNFVNSGPLDFIKEQTGGISFDRSGIELPAGTTSRITGRLKEALEALIPMQVLPGVIAPGAGTRAPVADYQQWFIQGGGSALQASVNRSSSAAMIGGAEGDALTGGGGNDFIFGDTGGDELKGGGGRDLIFGEGDADTVEGGLGDDYVEGGLGLDTYVYNAGDGQDRFFDIDGQGSVSIAGTTVGDAFKTTRTLEWTAEDASGRDITLTFLGAPTDIRGTLRIQGDALGGAGNRIDILNFAPTGPDNTYLGINLKSKKRIELVVGQNSNPWSEDGGHAAQSGASTTIGEGQGKTITVALSEVADVAQIVRLNVSGLADKFVAVLGEDVVPFQNGELTLTIAPGQSQASIALIENGDVDTDQTVTLSATLLPVAGDTGTTPVTHDLALQVDAREEPSGQAAQTTRDIIGDLEPVDFDPAQAGTQTRLDDLGNVIVGTTPAPNRVDSLNDSTGNDNIVAGGGNDVVNAIRGGDDMIDAGAGDDQVDAGPGDDRVKGGAGRDVIRGDIFAGVAGQDLLEGGDGGDLIYGMSGDDRIYGAIEIALQDAIAQGATGAGSALNGDFLQGVDGADLMVGTDGKDLISGGDGDDTLVAGQGDDYITGDAFYDAFTTDWNVAVTTTGSTTTFTVTGATLVSEGTGGDSVHAGGGDDGVLAGAGDDLVYGDDGSDKMWGDSGDDTLLGGTSDDLLNGDNGTDILPVAQHGSDFLDGGDGNDELLGMGGSDVLYGGAGDDQLFGDSGSENVGDDYLDGEDGNDIVVGAGGADTLVGGAGDDQLHGDSSDTPSSLQGEDLLYGEAGADLLQGYGGGDYLDGGSENDLLFGGQGDDTLLGSSGDDQLAGDDGTDTADGGDDYLDAGNGNDFVFGEGGDDVLIGGAGIDQLQGGQGDDHLDGGTDADNLFGQAGSDVLIGGEGNDQLVGDNGDLAPGGGDDVLDGGAGADALFGESGNDVLDGGDGDDQLVAGDGDDTLQGGTGIDLLLGETGNDVLSGDAGADQLQGGIGDDALDGGADDDVLFGEAGDDTLSGGDGSDQLIAGSGDDIMQGGQGNDFYVVRMGEGVDHISDSGGSDWLILSDAVFGNVRLDVGSLKLVFSGGGELHIDGWDPNNPLTSSPVEFIQFADNSAMTMAQFIQTAGFRPLGTPGEDDINGTALSDAINALAGNDFVDAGGGNDTVAAAEGNDVVLGGDGVDSLDGGSGDDVLLGGAGNDALLGGLGNDLLSGDAGNDTLQGGADADAYLFTRGSGQDVAIDTQGANSVQITGDVTSAQTGFRRSGNDLLIEIAATMDRLTVRDWFTAPAAWESVTLADGTLLDRVAVAARLVVNQSPILAPDTASTFEDNAVPVTGNALANDVDPERRALSVTTTGTRLGVYGTLTLQSTGTFSYSLNNATTAVQSLAQGQAVIDTFGYTATDNDPNGAATASSTIAVNIAGRNDAPVATADFASVSEDDITLTSGNVLGNDADVDNGAVLNVAVPGTFQGAYGTLDISLDGEFNYSLRNDSSVVQSLGQGVQASDSFTYAVSDGMMQTSAQLQVIVEGRNDVPVVSIPLEDQSVSAGRSFNYTIPLGSFTDIDAGDIQSYGASLADGSSLPSWLAFDAAMRTFSGSTPRDATGFLDIGVEVTDGHSEENSDGLFESSASDVFRLSFDTSAGGGGGGGGGGGKSGGNEGVGNGQDGPPPGHDHSFNDGEGTSPGNPGAKGGNGYVPLEPPHAPSLAAHPVAAQTATGMGTHGHSARLAFGDNNGNHNAGNDSQRRSSGDSSAGNAFAKGQDPNHDVIHQASDALGAAQGSSSPASDDSIEALLAEDPRYDFQALFDWLANESASSELLDAAEIARRWSRIARYASDSGNGMSDDAHAAAFGWQGFADQFAAANGAAPVGLSQFVGLGTASGLPDLESFRGLSEGMATL